MVAPATNDEVSHAKQPRHAEAISWSTQRRERDAQSILKSLGRLPRGDGRTALVIMSGLPGSGKTFLARRLASRIGAIVLHSDKTRKLLVSNPQYTPRENARVFLAMHAATGILLDQGISVIFDATNLTESDRDPLYRVAAQHGVPWLLIRTVAPPEVIRKRMTGRAAAQDPFDYSDADLRVFELMRTRVQPIRGPHLVVHSNEATTRAVDRIVRALWGLDTRPMVRSAD